MIAIDTNILVYAHRKDSPFYATAAQAVRDLAEGGASWAIAWPCLHEFLAIVTHPKIYKPATPLAKALAQIDTWLESPSLQLLHENSDYWFNLKDVVSSSQVVGGKIHDARIAAICLYNNVKTLWSVDRDFSRFKDLTVINPLRP